MTNAEMKVNRLATIHKDLIAVAAAVSGAAADIRNGRCTLKAAAAEHHTAATDEVAARLDRMTLNASDIGPALRGQVRDCVLAYEYQRDRCKRNKAQFVQQGAFVDALREGGMFQELIALRKAAKAAAAEGKDLAPALDVVVATAKGEEAPAPAVEAPVLAVVYFKGNEKGDTGAPVGLKHVTKTKDINTALEETLDQFEVVGPVRVFINDVEVSGLFANEVLREIRQERKAKALALEKIESLLKAEAVDFLNEADAMAALSGCVLATKLRAIYQEELAKRRQEVFGLCVGQKVHTPVGSAVVESFDRHVVGEVKIRFPGDRGATTTHHSKLLPC